MNKRRGLNKLSTCSCWQFVLAGCFSTVPVNNSESSSLDTDSNQKHSTSTKPTRGWPRTSLQLCCHWEPVTPAGDSNTSPRVRACCCCPWKSRPVEPTSQWGPQPECHGAAASQWISRFPNWTDLGDPLGVKVGSPIFGSLGLEAANHVLIVHPMEARKLMSFGSMWPTEPTATWKIVSRCIKHGFVTWWKSAVLVVLYLPNVTHSLGPQAESKEEAVAFEMQDGMGNTPGQLGQCSKPRCQQHKVL